MFSEQSVRALHHHILDISHTVCSLTAPFARHESVKFSVSTSLCSMPPPRSITSLLVTLGIHPQVAELSSRTYLQHALQLKQAYEQQLRRVSHVWLNPVGALDDGKATQIRLRSAFVEHYRNTLGALVKAIIEEHLAQIHKKSAPVKDTSKARPAFNKDAVPTLEAAYQSNPFPDREEKEQLARMTSMDRAQIKHWFQNRRSRAKKAGQEPQRPQRFVSSSKHGTLGVSGRLSIDSDCLLQEVKEVIDVSISNNNSELFLSAERRSEPICTTEPPAHVFPTPFKRSDAKFARLLPNDLELGHFELTWVRDAVIRPSQPQPVSNKEISDLATAFSKLSVYDPNNTGHKWHHSAPPVTFHTVPLPAPLPALLRPMKPVVTPPATSPTSVAAKREVVLFPEELEKEFLSQVPRHKRSARPSHEKARRHHKSTALSLLDDEPHFGSKRENRRYAPIPKRVPQTLPELIPHRPHRRTHSGSSRSSSIVSNSSDDSLSSLSSTQSELRTPPTPALDLPYVSRPRKESSSRHSSFEYSHMANPTHISRPRKKSSSRRSPVEYSHIADPPHQERSYTWRTIVA